MKWVRLAFLLSPCLYGQNTPGPAARGEQIFPQTCGSGYCHGGGGAGGGAPRIAARGFTQPFITTTVTRGVPGTAMAAFGTTLPDADLNALIAYVSKLNGIAANGSGAAVAATPKLSPEAAQGKTWFSEASRSFGRCSTCHEVGNRGLAVAAPMQKIPTTVAALKNLATPHVVTSTVRGESMPAIMVANKSTSVTFYDLTVPPPVLRTEGPGVVQITPATTWTHASVLGAYSDKELAAILAYLRVAR